MKVGLASRDGISILNVSGAVDAHNFAVLKAGISKLFRDGKNRIVLNLEDAQEIEGEIIRELAILDVFARELAGKIVLVSPHEDLKASVRIFAKPPVIAILSTEAQALEYFKHLSEALESTDGDVLALRKELGAQTKVIAELEERLAALQPAKLEELRKENAALAEKVTLLEGQVEALTRADRAPRTDAGYLEKIAALEASVKRLAGEQATQ